MLETRFEYMHLGPTQEQGRKGFVSKGMGLSLGLEFSSGHKR